MLIGIDDCPFCRRIRKGDFEGRFGGAVWLTPLNPVTPGHMLFIPGNHINENDDDGWIQGGIAAVGAVRFYRIHNLKGEDYNLILNSGENATQSIEHMHLHYIPRREGDGLVLPWTNQKKH